MKFLSTIVALLLATTAVYAQDYTEDDDLMFNHMSLGLNVGTTGVGLDLTMPLGKYVQVRAGATYMPAVGIKSKLDCAATDFLKDENGNIIKETVYDANNNEITRAVQYQLFTTYSSAANDINIESTPNFINGKLMFDFYPAPSFPLHITLGAYFGGKKIIKLQSVGDEDRIQSMYYHTSANYSHQFYDNVQGVKLGNYTLLSTHDGKIDSWIETSAIRPYAGLGWGKAYSEKGIDWMVEAGVIYWSKPKVYSRTTDLSPFVTGGNFDANVTTIVERPAEELSGNQGAILKWFSKTSIYPVINFRVGFNMF